jgi:hypothetical protein
MKMNFPLSLSDVGLWLAVTALILLITSELVYSLPDVSARIMIDKKRFRLVSLGCGLGFMVTVIMRLSLPS